MILPDTSVWVDHLRRPDSRLLDLMVARQVLVHPYIIGELALGGNRVSMVLLMQRVKQVVRADDAEVLRLIQSKRLYGRGIGYVDTHLLASVMLTPGSQLWTRDKKLHAVASELGIAA